MRHRVLIVSVCVFACSLTQGYEKLSVFRQACKQVDKLFPSQNANSYNLWRAMGIAQHHDAVSATEKQHAAYDYAMRQSIGEDECSTVITR